MVISLTKKNPEKKIHFKAFNSTYFELLKMMKENSDNNRDFKRFYNHNLFIKNTNIKMFIRTWYQNITCIYKEQIMSGDIDYFLKKGKMITGVCCKDKRDSNVHILIIKEHFIQVKIV